MSPPPLFSAEKVNGIGLVRGGVDLSGRQAGLDEDGVAMLGCFGHGGIGMESLAEEGEAVAGETGAGGSTLSAEATEEEHG